MRAKRVLRCGIILLGISSSLQLFAQEAVPQGNPGKPDIRITVHKKTDKDGNIVSYDSTYSYSYSGNGADNAQMKEMLKNWGGGMNMQFFSQPSDSLPGYINEPFFQQFNTGNIDMEKMQKMMEQQMRELMQNNYWSPDQNIYMPPPTPVKPAPERKRPTRHPSKKAAPKQNIPDEGVRI